MTDRKNRVFDPQSSSQTGHPSYDSRGERSSLSVHTDANPGLTVMGTESGCGKTAIMTGLTAAFRQQGLAIRAVKPVCLGQRDRSEAELSFISSITGTPRNYPATFAASAKNLSYAQWSQALSICLNTTHLTMVETPGSLATPMSFEQSDPRDPTCSWKDSTDFAVELHFPVLIVAKHNEEAIEKLVLAWSYASTHSLVVAGLVTVETANGEGRALESKLSRSEVSLILNSRTSVPYLGCLKYSPSISVPRVNQGNLVKMTETGVDTLVVRKALEAAVAK